MTKLQEITVDVRYRDLLLTIWRSYYDEHIRTDERVASTRKSEIDRKTQERNRLLDLRLQELIDDRMFREKKAQLDGEIARLETMTDHEASVEAKVVDTERVLNFMTEPKSRFPVLPTEDKRTTVHHLGSSYSLTDGKMAMELNILLVPAQKHARKFEASCYKFSRTVYRSESNKKAAFNRLCFAWGPIWDTIRTTAVENGLWFPVISFE